MHVHPSTILSVFVHPSLYIHKYICACVHAEFVFTQHVFREPEKRPPVVVSMAFSGLLLVPFAIMLLAVSCLSTVLF